MRLKQILIFVLIFTFSIPLFAQKAPQKTNTKKLVAEIQKLLKLKKAQKTKIGIYVKDVNSGEVLLNIKGEELFNPASNIKILTSAAALDKLGAAKKWATRISAGSFENGVVDTLYLKSDGDPLIRYNHILEWAIRLKQLGVKSVKGGMVVDTSVFHDHLPPAFEQFDEDASYRADISSFSVNYNGVALVITPTEIGKEAKIVMRPPNTHVVYKGKITTSKGWRSKIIAEAKKTAKGTEITISGTIGASSGVAMIRKRVDYPSLYGASIFKSALESLGIKVKGKIRNGVRPEKAITLHFHLSEPLWYAIMMMNKFSNNFIAEQIYQLMGINEEGTKSTPQKSKTILSDFMNRVTKTKGYKQVNGSGLYVGNYASPMQFVDVLVFMTKHHAYPEFAASLAVAGSDGTLKGRLKKLPSKGNARGKTGTLSAVSALSGYLKTKSGRQVAYSILFNDPPIHAARMRKIQDAMLQKIAAFNK